MLPFKKVKCYAAVLCCLLLLLALPGCSQAEEPAETTAPKSAAMQPIQQREGIQTILVSVLDQYDVSSETGSFRNGLRADLLMLMVVDNLQGETTVLQLNPDTVVSFAAPGSSETIQIPIGLTYSYGSGGSDSFLSASKAISNLFGGIKLDHYMIFTMDAIAAVNDMLGGVAVEGEESKPLTGQEAAEYLRRRDAEDVDNSDHMNRQRQYMQGLYGPFMTNAQNDDFLAQLTLKMGDGMSTDLTLSQMVQMMDLLGSYELKDSVVTLTGEASVENGEYRFYTDEAALKQTMEALFLN